MSFPYNFFSIPTLWIFTRSPLSSEVCSLILLSEILLPSSGFIGSSASKKNSLKMYKYWGLAGCLAGWILDTIVAYCASMFIYYIIPPIPISCCELLGPACLDLDIHANNLLFLLIIPICIFVSHVESNFTADCDFMLLLPRHTHYHTPHTHHTCLSISVCLKNTSRRPRGRNEKKCNEFTSAQHTRSP